MPAPRILFQAGPPHEGVRQYRFRFGTEQALVAGLEAVEQHTLLHLLATPNTDRYTDRGGGLLAIWRAHQQGAPFEQTTLDVQEAVHQAKEQLLTSQIGENLAPSEQLADVVVVSIGRTPDRRLRIDLRVTNVAGESRTLRL